MVMQRGKWALWSRGSGASAAFPLTQWTEVSEHYGVNVTFEELLPAFLQMKQQGQHVRLEWMPEAAYGMTPNVNAEPDFSEAEERELKAWYGDKDVPIQEVGYV